ncbi:conjugative transposon protein TraM [Olivibacter jilunii]|uniref:conjugative transposon protein TraM n=1 Tax=Olivibacter jilunii TaxID=985016 RepID=UPI00103033CB|nr:conjugative transposon protein TraM [Olivibacter jilunii]
MEKLKDTRKVFLVMPLLVLPFLTFAFYAMGGGRGVKAEDEPKVKGINMELPNASFQKKKEPKDKMGFYQAAPDTGNQKNSMADMVAKMGFSVQEDPKAAEIDQKLKAIQEEINRPEKVPEKETGTTATRPNPVEPQHEDMGRDIDRLEALMETMKKDSTDDEEMKELNTLLQTIIDIQHPQRIKDRLPESEREGNSEPDSTFKAVPAIITDKQKVSQGATVRLQLQDSTVINGQHLPKGFYLYATCRIANQRVLLNIRNIRFGTSIVPVNLSVYGLDGMEGIDAPQAVLTEAANLGTGNFVSGIGMYGLDQSIASQVAGAGMEAARNVISKKVRKIKVKLKAGEPVLLKNNDLKSR